MPIVRTFVSLPAGIERMPMPLFVGYTALGSLVWNATLLFAGYQAGDNWQTVEQYANVFTALGLVLALVLIGRFVAIRVRARRRATAAGSGAPAEAEAAAEAVEPTGSAKSAQAAPHAEEGAPTA
ncbi:DedA family protein [Streptomyces johnsoniae]|uniref:DedA family protein n=1 Tax=Streptomyces johnsoniae TaxID=3075532 RepID=A0ABU2S2B7_9ACTN|nr:hypothetical protein [Streptomyces sp. DSM 41886]MDT0442235.1 hypothetical protein [Streptomyces sp. DSM 41886]